ncbi:SEC-C metal-binding domain-containing protein, partial [Acidobacteriota bacterium]
LHQVFLGIVGRQGDPGTSRFFLSLEDDLMRIFGGERLQNVMGKIGMQEGEPIEHNMVSKAIERAQTQVEAQHFEIRKQLLKYDDVMNKQREAFYALRRDVLTADNPKKYLMEISKEVLGGLVDEHLAEDKDPRDWDTESMLRNLKEQFGWDMKPFKEQFDVLSREELESYIWEKLQEHYNEKENTIPPEILRRYERDIMLYRADENWKNHLFEMDHLKEGIGLRGYGQRDPLIEYKRESFNMFQDMMTRIEDQITRYMFRLQPVSAQEDVQPVRRQQKKQNLIFSSGDGGKKKQEPVRKDKKVGRNAPCPCGSGKKFKKCCGD